MSMRVWRLFSPKSLAAVVVVFLFALQRRSQTVSTAQLSGVVHDQTGAVVPGASVKLENPSKGFSRNTVSDGQGNYQFLLIPPGTYSVTAQATNFNPIVENNIVLTVGQQVELQITLPVGQAREQIVVEANAELIETQRSSQATTVDQQRINNLPINGRNYINFTLTNSQIARDAAPAV